MRQAYWLLFGALILLVFIGTFAFSVPTHSAFQGVSTRVFDLWYWDRVRAGIIIGGSLGIVSGLLTTQFLTVQAADTSEGFAAKVLTWSFIALGGTAAIALLLQLQSGANAEMFDGLPTKDRIESLLAASRFWLVVAAAVLSAQFTFAALTRVRRWAGRYAILKVGHGK